MKATVELIQDILDAIIAIEAYDLPTYEAFLEDEKTQDAILYNLIIMGEAANKVPSEFQDEHSEIPWSSIIGTRNVVVHGYDQVKLRIVWDIIRKNLAPLKESLAKLIIH